MIARGGGSIVNASSYAGFGPWPHVSVYAVGKAAVTRLGENLATETKEHGISVFSIYPGGVRTAMLVQAFLSDAAREYCPDIYNYWSQGGSGVPLSAQRSLSCALPQGGPMPSLAASSV
jgi:NAD(P)-dependent dehydrogenase (short-subunit alcohol dehydrogenase family)